MPDSICQSTNARRAGSSMEPCGVKGVISAVPQPVVSILGEFIPAGGGYLVREQCTVRGSSWRQGDRMVRFFQLGEFRSGPTGRCRRDGVAIPAFSSARRTSRWAIFGSSPGDVPGFAL